MKLLRNFVPRSLIILLGTPYLHMMSEYMNFAIVCASASSTATPSRYLVKKSTAKMMYYLPVSVLGSEPITLMLIYTKGFFRMVADDASGIFLFFLCF